MITLADILKSRHVDLALGSEDPAKGIEDLAQRFEGDPGISNWTAFHSAVKLTCKPIGMHSLLSHVRTDQVSKMLMAAGRMPVGTGAVSDDDVESVHFLFLIAVPMTLASDYLQIVGALARSLRNPATVAALWEARAAEEFVRILCAEAAAV